MYFFALKVSVSPSYSIWLSVHAPGRPVQLNWTLFGILSQESSIPFLPSSQCPRLKSTPLSKSRRSEVFVVRYIKKTVSSGYFSDLWSSISHHVTSAAYIQNHIICTCLWLILLFKSIWRSWLNHSLSLQVSLRI